MKTLSKMVILSLSATMVASVAMAQPYPAYNVLEDLSAEQVTQLKQLGQLSANDYINPVYDAKVERILTPAQNTRYTQTKYGPTHPSHSNDFKFDMDSH